MMEEVVHKGIDETSKDKEYRNILRGLGFKKPENEQITKDELGFIFMQLQEAIGM